jgi:hypothetical protein
MQKFDLGQTLAIRARGYSEVVAAIEQSILELDWSPKI